ncbi:MAG: FtsX-like permease family protein [Traorella sp.]
MNRFFYWRLAFQNLKKNSKMIFPYILTSSLLIMMFYIMVALANHSDFVGRQRGLMLSYGVVVIGVFAVIFLFYTNSFIIKQRKSEFGIYNILGLEKKHLTRVLIYETIVLAVFSITIGILTGMLFGQLIFLFLVRLINRLPTMSFEFDFSFVKDTICLFVTIFFLTCLYNIAQIQLSKPIDLLKSKSEGEKEPKVKWLLALIGVVSLLAGYGIALWVDNPMDSLFYFFVAVILVIIGTYCLFTAGSIALLKILRKNKKYYYQTNHFVAVSNMIYRMKQNAVGLANICILSTMVLVMMFSTSALYVQIEDIIESQVPHDVLLKYANEDNRINQKVNERLQLLLSDLPKKNYHSEYGFQTMINFNGNKVALSNYETYTNYYYLTILANDQVGLNENEAMLYFDDFNLTSLEVNDKTYQVKTMTKDEVNQWFDSSYSYDYGFKGMGYLILKDEQAVYQFYEDLCYLRYSEADYPGYIYFFDADLNTNELDDFQDQVMTIFDEERRDSGYTYTIKRQDDVRYSIYDIFGSFFFLGIFLSILFMIATTLIMYYKQISEGYDDIRRYDILMSVGMSQIEVKKTIDSQILFVFFMPLIVAGIHIMFSYNIIYQLFRMFGMNNQVLFIRVMAVVYVIFALFYYIIYHLTAREYYKIVSK